MIVKKKIFLTGGTGFIGKNTLEKLGDKYSFAAPSRRQLDLLDSYSVEQFLKLVNPDIVIHAAKYGGTRKVPNSYETAEINLRMFFNIVRNNKFFKKMIFLGSGSEYNISRPLKRVKEEEFDRRVPEESFGFYKYMCSKYIGETDKIINLRLFGIFGKYEDYELRFISNAICKNLFGLPITMRQNVFFDYLYINDFIKIIDYFINNGSKYKFYNAGTGRRIDLLTIAKKINKLSEKPSKIIIRKRGLNNEYTCNNDRLKREMPALKFTDFDRSILELYTWYKSIKPSISYESLLIDK